MPTNVTTLSRRRFLIASAAVPAATALGAFPAGASTPVSFAGWQFWTFRGIPPTNFALNGDTLSINAQQSASVVYGIVPTALRGASSASWQWQVSQGVGPTNLAARGGDDRAIAIYFVFVDAETASRFGDTTPSMSRLLGMRSGRTLIYVWGGNNARGTVLDSPYLRGRGKTVILRGASPGGWTSETVDLAADHQRAFGSPKQTLIAIGVSSDSDDTGAINAAAVRSLALA